VAGALAEADLRVEDLGLRQPTLDEVFLTLTGTPIEDPNDPSEPAPQEVPA
jgi:ABC-2 type transport system ATP-binding protein